MADRGRRGLAGLLVAAAVCASTAGAGDVRAKVTFTKRGHEFVRVQLTIKRGETTWRSGLLGKAYFIRPKVTVRDLDADGEPEVWVDRYTGGAHCCLESRFFRWLPVRRRYAMTLHGWADIGYQLRNLDRLGPPELVSADARFAYAFTSFAGSAFPLRVWRFDRRRLLDVTRRFPDRVERDADELWRAYLRYRRGPDDPRGVLAAWVADQYLLGRGEEGWATLETLQRRRAFGPRPDLAGWPQGRAYLRALHAFLVKTGYARRGR
jgi:hypothetical protein